MQANDMAEEENTLKTNSPQSQPHDTKHLEIHPKSDMVDACALVCDVNHSR